MIITEPKHRALAAVQRGEVWREYRADGNVLKGPAGVSPKVLWDLERGMLIDETRERTKPGARVPMVLTERGKDALAAPIGTEPRAK